MLNQPAGEVSGSGKKSLLNSQPVSGDWLNVRFGFVCDSGARRFFIPLVIWRRTAFVKPTCFFDAVALTFSTASLTMACEAVSGQ